jgi:D-galactarolactone isomerase
VAVIAPDAPDSEMERLSAAGVVGARVMDLPGGAVGLSHLEALDARCLSAGWVMAVQFDGTHILDHEPRLGRIKSRWTLDHHAKILGGARPDGPEVAAIKRLLDRGNCWFKLAGCYESSKAGAPDYADIGAITREIVAHAPERVVWGTNWPHNAFARPEEAPDEAGLFDTVMGWLPDEATRTQVLVDTPRALFFAG